MSIQHIQTIGGAATVAGQLSFSSTSTSFTAGNLLVALVTWSLSGTTASGTINLPAGWTDSGQSTINNGAPNGCARAFYMFNTGGSQSWTWSVTVGGGGGSQSWAYTILEFGVADSTANPDLTVISNKTGASSATPIDTTAASGNTKADDLLIQLVGISRSTISITGSNSGSVPSTGWTVDTLYDSTNGTPNVHATSQWQILTSEVNAPRGELTPSVSCSWETFLLTFKALPVQWNPYEFVRAGSGISVTEKIR